MTNVMLALGTRRGDLEGLTGKERRAKEGGSTRHCEVGSDCCATLDADSDGVLQNTEQTAIEREVRAKAAFGIILGLD